MESENVVRGVPQPAEKEALAFERCVNCDAASIRIP